MRELERPRLSRTARRSSRWPEARVRGGAAGSRPRRARTRPTRRARPPPAPVTPHSLPKTTISGSITTVSTPCATSRRPGRPIVTGNVFVQLSTSWIAAATRISRAARHRRQVVGAEQDADRATASSSSAGTSASAASSRRARDVAADPGEHDLGPPVLPVARLLAEQDHPQRRGGRASPSAASWAARKSPTSRRAADDAERQRRDPRAHRDQPGVGGALARRSGMIGPRSSPSGPGAAAGNRRRLRRTPTRGSRSWSAPARRRTPTTAAVTPCARRSRSRRAAARSRTSASAAQVVAAAEDQRRGRDRLERLERRQRAPRRGAAPRGCRAVPKIESANGAIATISRRGERTTRASSQPNATPDETVEPAPVLARPRSGSRTSRARRRSSARRAAPGSRRPRRRS